MKFLKSILTVVMMALSVCAYAQFANSGSSSSGLSLSSSTDDYARFQIGYVTSNYKYDGKTIDGMDSFNGVTAGVIYGKNINQSMPLFLEYGANLTWLNWNDSEDDWEDKWNIVNIAVPVNLAYKIGFGNDNFSIVPFAGINFKVNLVSKEKEEEDGDSETWDWFDKKDVGSDFQWNRFQLGGQIGIGINYKQLYIGYQFQVDFMELAKKTKMPTNSIILGISIN
jgi:hypothetical protein